MPLWLQALPWGTAVLSPIDLVPDFVPVVGYADDAVIVALVLRSVIKRAGAGAVARHWPGSAAGLDAILKAASPMRRRR
ncbi:YkvA family protein [Arthrobacter sp. MPF02]|uniref:YkvA family protein n=1 Tax=Arthrobacter sp. MPF02 TaxID=3388492 RepID=UPI0039855DEC